MSFDDMLVRDVTILHAATVVDGYGEPALSWANPTSTATQGWLGQREETEPQSAGRTAVTVVRDVLQLPAGTVITARDRVVIDGVTYEVDGQPRNVWTPRGSHHVRVNLTAVAG
jgi:hypothetical protein